MMIFRPSFRRLAIAAAAMLVLPAAAHAGDMPVLRAAATVAGPVVRLGDLVKGAGPLAHVALFRAPDPGTTGPVAAETVIAAARAAGLANVDRAGLSEVEVTRAARRLGAEELTAALGPRLAAAVGVADPAALAVTFDEGEMPLNLPADATGAPSVADVTWSPADNSFRAVVAVTGRSGDPVRRVVTGRAVETAQAVVMVRDVARGDILGPDDVEVTRRPRAELGGGSLIKAAEAVGREATHTLRAGEALSAADVAEPELVKRGELVTVVFQTAGMRLTLRGRAMRSGRRGDVVSVMNLQSRRVLQGTVGDTGEVLLTPVQSVTTALR
jgi:flagella basal body P-ring formation protein FlgA